MSEKLRAARASLHSYQPLVVDENSLLDEERREAIVGAVARPRAWLSHITQKEREAYNEEIAELEKQHEIWLRNTPGLYCAGESRLVANTHHELVQRGTMRAFAREKYGLVSLGDGPPPWSR